MQFNKCETIFRRWHFQTHFLSWQFRILIQFSLNFVRMVPINNKLALVHIMAWHQIGRQATIWTNDGLIYWHIYASLSLNDLNIQITNYPEWISNYTPHINWGIWFRIHTHKLIGVGQSGALISVIKTYVQNTNSKCFHQDGIIPRHGYSELCDSWVH